MKQINSRTFIIRFNMTFYKCAYIYIHVAGYITFNVTQDVPNPMHSWINAYFLGYTQKKKKNMRFSLLVCCIHKRHLYINLENSPTTFYSHDYLEGSYKYSLENFWFYLMYRLLKKVIFFYIKRFLISKKKKANCFCKQVVDFESFVCACVDT